MSEDEHVGDGQAPPTASSEHPPGTHDEERVSEAVVPSVHEPGLEATQPKREEEQGVRAAAEPFFSGFGFDPPGRASAPVAPQPSVEPEAKEESPEPVPEEPEPLEQIGTIFEPAVSEPVPAPLAEPVEPPKAKTPKKAKKTRKAKKRTKKAKKKARKAKKARKPRKKARK